MTDVGGVPVVHTGGWGENGGGGWIGMLLVLALLGGRGFGGFGHGCGDGYGYGHRGNFGCGELGWHDRHMENQFLQRDMFGLQKDILLQGEKIIHNQDRCCCETNRNIDSVKFEACKNTDRIIENATHNTQRILDKMCADELRIAYAKIAEMGQMASEARIIAAMKPVQPIPAYLQPNPFESFRIPCPMGHEEHRRVG